MRYIWSFRKASATRWALILTEDSMEAREVRAPGYESSRASDIIRAMMYLNSGFAGNLPEHTLQLLDSIREDTFNDLQYK